MGNPKPKRVMILIDGSNFYHSLKKTLKEKELVNYKKLINLLTGEGKLVNVSYYVAPLDFETNSKKYWDHQKFLNNLREIPNFNVVLCNLKKIKKERGGFEFVVKGDDILLAQDLLMGAFDDLYDTVIIVSGDEDFFPLIKVIRERFKKEVGNAYFRSSSSYKLKKACNFSIKLNKIISEFVYKKEDKSSSVAKRQH